MPDDLHVLLQKVKDLRDRQERLVVQLSRFAAETRRLVSSMTSEAGRPERAQGIALRSLTRRKRARRLSR